MHPTVAIFAPGNMGAALARRLVEAGVEVRTCLAGRGPESVRRAEDAGFTLVDAASAVDVDVLLSVVPPKEALALARGLAPHLAAAPRKPVYVDCNAVSPETVRAIEAVVAATGTPFVDGSIIGLPPKPGYDGPAIFVSGARARDVEVLAAHGLMIRPLGDAVGEASALKMCYGGLTKGLIAIGAAMLLAADRSGASPALRAELARSQAQLFAGFAKSVPDMLPKAQRWVAEMEEIAAFLGTDRPEAEAYAAFGRFYERLASEAGAADVATLAAYFRPPAA